MSKIRSEKETSKTFVCHDDGRFYITEVLNLQFKCFSYVLTDRKDPLREKRYASKEKALDAIPKQIEK